MSLSIRWKKKEIKSKKNTNKWKEKRKGRLEKSQTYSSKITWTLTNKGKPQDTLSAVKNKVLSVQWSLPPTPSLCLCLQVGGDLGGDGLYPTRIATLAQDMAVEGVTAPPLRFRGQHQTTVL